ncbi:MAG: acyl-CoA dehydrogenase family protein [bacterium]|nr:acyl-CoA dehydrogenase family protein [bacterium]
MDFSLTENQLALQQMAHEFAEREMRPVAQELDRKPVPEERTPWAVLEKASQIGLRTLSVPEKMGGGGADMLTCCLVGEELGWGELGIAITLDQDWKLARFYTGILGEKQREKFLSRFLPDHQFHLAIASSEPNAGTDNMIAYPGAEGGLRASAVRDGNDWVVNGRKHFIINGGLAKLYVLSLRTDPGAPVSRGVTYMMADPEMEGFSIGRYHDKMGLRLAQNVELVFENLRIPDENRLTPVNDALEARTKHLRGSNVESTATVLGTARAAYEDALEYARNRVQGGRPIIEHQAIGFMLCDCFVEYEASRRLLHYAAWMAGGDGPWDRKLGDMTKVYLSETCFRIATKALEVWGGMGYMTESPMEKYLRDVTSWFHTEGTNEAMKIRAMRTL